MRLNQANA